MSWMTATEAATTLLAEVTSALGWVLDERVQLRSLNAEKLFALAEQQAAFHARVRPLEQTLLEALHEVAQEHGLEEVTFASLQSLGAPEALALVATLTALRTQSGALSREQLLNRALIERSLQMLRAYTQAVSPKVTAYGRRGLEAPRVSNPSSISSRA